MKPKHRLIALRLPDDLPEEEPLVIVQQATFEQAREALKVARGVINSSMLDMASLNEGRAPLEHVQTLRNIDQALAAMNGEK